jgi:hypothetical protein
MNVSGYINLNNTREKLWIQTGMYRTEGNLGATYMDPSFRSRVHDRNQYQFGHLLPLYTA